MDDEGKQFILRIRRHGKRFHYEIFKRVKILFWESWEWRASTWHVSLVEHYIEKYGMTKDNTIIQRWYEAECVCHG